MRAFTASAIFLSCCTIALGQPSRDPRAIALFNVVTFPNVECQSTENDDNKGTCLSSTECSDKGGSAEGNCASGFGVCCVIRISKEEGGDVTHNCTIVENKDYPTAYTTKSKKAEYKIKPLEDICFLRYDFIALDLDLTANTGVCKDKLEITVPTEAGSSPKALCGLNNGLHMYTDNMRVTTETTLKVTTDTSETYSRKWKIKISQIPCDSQVKPQPGCTQYYTANCGTFESFNFQATTSLLVSEFDVTICVRQNVGMCGTTLTQDISSTKDTFGLPTLSKTIAVPSTGASVVHSYDTATAADLVAACEYARFQVGGHAYCGGALNSAQTYGGLSAGGTALTDAGTPGPVSSNDFVYHLVNIGTDAKSAVGYKLNYKQTGCTYAV